MITSRVKYFLFINCILFLSISSFAQDPPKSRIILDADTGNEVDDYYALVRAFIEPSWEIICLNATQWQASQWAVPASMENSHRLNQVLISEMGMEIQTRRGGVDRMFDWGDMAQHSAAAYEIIKQAKSTPEGEKLRVVAFGALTNVASAIFIEPTVASKIELFWLGTTYDFEKGILKRQDFNCMMDQQALETILMSKVEMHVMPINTAVKMKFGYQETEAYLPQGNQVSRLLLDRWFEHLDGGRTERILWDLALVQAMLFPEWAKKSTITTSRDNGQRPIHYYTDIESDKMKKEFFDSVNQFFK